jgi:small multidrug resistance pump
LDQAGLLCRRRGSVIRFTLQLGSTERRQSFSRFDGMWGETPLAAGCELSLSGDRNCQRGRCDLGIEGGRALPSAIALVGYVTAFYFLSLTLRTLPLGVAYAVWAGAGTMLVALSGWVIFQQALDAAAIVGIALMLVGAVIVNAFSNAVSH